MGLSVFNQVDKRKYFSISSIDKEILHEKGITMPISDFKQIVKRSPPHMQITTGSDIMPGRSRMTKIYCYDDFIYLANSNLKGGDSKVS